MTNAAVARDHMIDCQLRPNEVNDERVIGAIAGVARESYVPKAKRSFAYMDEDIAVAAGRYLMEPVTFARLVVAAGVKDTDLVLDVGCATGYSSAVLSGMASTVVALESDEGLYATAEKTLADEGVINAAVVKGDLTKGVAKQGPFDVIFLNGAVPEVPKALIKQLSDGGRIAYVRQEDGVGRGCVITKTDDGLVEENLFDAHVASLPGFEKEAGFVF